MSYIFAEVKQGGVELRGAARELWGCKDHEVIISGPAETGKTFGALHKLDALMWKYNGAQAVIVRKTYKSCVSSVLQTYKNKVVSKDAGIKAFGNEHPEFYAYPNGSRIWVGGMDNPDKVLSSERDFIYVNQAEELALSDWETLLTRATGRAGNAPYSQVFGDCNPGGSRHWIRQRAAIGKTKLLTSIHKDNPNLYTADGELTEQGRITLGILDGLSGVRLRRLRYGEWATAEGAVYEMFSNQTHVIHREASEFVRFYMAQDEGYTNPAVILLVGEDSDGRLHILREFYERGKLQADVVAAALALWEEYSPTMDAVDAAAAGLIADLRNNGINAIPAKGRVIDGINQVQNRLKAQGDTRPRLTIEPDCINTINEFESYVWKAERDEPVKENDHALDALRYLIDTIDQGGSLVLFGA